MKTNLIKLEDGRFVVEHGGRFLQGTRKEALRYMQKVVQTDREELLFAMEDMIQKGNNFAHFGVIGGGTFLFSQTIDPELYFPAAGNA